MKNYSIALIRGDGIGPEVVEEGVKVLNAAAEAEGVKLSYTEYPFGADYYLKTKEVLPDSAIADFKTHDAIYLGAVGDPRIKPGIIEHGLLLTMRFELDQYINLRPVKLYPNVTSPIAGAKNVDIQLVRENVEDFYIRVGNIFKDGAGRDGRYSTKMKRGIYECDFDISSRFSTDDDYAYNLGLISGKGAERVARFAFELAVNKGRKKVSCITKMNAVPHSYSIWEERFKKVSANYPDIKTECTNVDATAMWMVSKPDDYDVVLAPNLFGDILSDLSSAICGGLGFGGSGNINPAGVSMFEPIHGSAPHYAGKNVVNPIATILAGAMMMDQLGESGMAKRMERAVYDAMNSGFVKTKDRVNIDSISKTNEIGDIIVKYLREHEKQ